MKHIFIFFIASFSLFMTSCDKHTHGEDVEYEYHAHIHTPNADDKNVDDSFEIEVEFESHTGETVHNIQVRLYNVADGTEVYNAMEHVHAESGKYTYTDTFVLSNDNGVVAHTDWILEAKVWGHEDGEGEVIETVQFHVHP